MTAPVDVEAVEYRFNDAAMYIPTLITQDVPALLAEVHALRAQLAQAEAELAAAHEAHADAMAEAEPPCTYDLIRQRDSLQARAEQAESALACAEREMSHLSLAKVAAEDRANKAEAQLRAQEREMEALKLRLHVSETTKLPIDATPVLLMARLKVLEQAIRETLVLVRAARFDEAPQAWRDAVKMLGAALNPPGPATSEPMFCPSCRCAISPVCVCQCSPAPSLPSVEAKEEPKSELMRTRLHRVQLLLMSLHASRPDLSAASPAPGDVAWLSELDTASGHVAEVMTLLDEPAPAGEECECDKDRDSHAPCSACARKNAAECKPEPPSAEKPEHKPECRSLNTFDPIERCNCGASAESGKITAHPYHEHVGAELYPALKGICGCGQPASAHASREGAGK